MLISKATKCVLGGTLAACVLVAGMQPAEAAIRFKYTPPFGTPFNDLEWEGEATIQDGACTALGNVSNFGSACGGQLSFEDVTLTLSSLGNYPGVSQTLGLSGAMVINIQRTGLTAPEFQGVSGTPFAPVQFAGVPSAEYNGAPAWFSFVMLGGADVQLYWFKNNPGSYFQNPDVYTACSKVGVNMIGGNVCGQSSNTAVGVFLPVPEPSTYAMLFAGLGALGFVARRRKRKV